MPDIDLAKVKSLQQLAAFLEPRIVEFEDKAIDLRIEESSMVSETTSDGVPIVIARLNLFDKQAQELAKLKESLFREAYPKVEAMLLRFRDEELGAPHLARRPLSPIPEAKEKTITPPLGSSGDSTDNPMSLDASLPSSGSSTGLPPVNSRGWRCPSPASSSAVASSSFFSFQEGSSTARAIAAARAEIRADKKHG